MEHDAIFEEKNTENFTDTLDKIVKEGARKILQQAVENEVFEFVEQNKGLKIEGNQQAIVRNGYLPERAIQTGTGELLVKQPRVRDKRKVSHFTSAILPPYVRRSPSIENLIPALYLKGVSTGDFSEALAAILD